MTSRLSQRSKRQEKFRRHIASHASTDSRDSKGEDAETSEDRNAPVSDRSGSRSPYNPTKQKIRYVAASQPSEDSLESKPSNGGESKPGIKSSFHSRLANRQRLGRSLTRSSSGANSRSSSVSSETSKNDQEPGKIVSKPRSGRSLTRSSSGPNSRASSVSSQNSQEPGKIAARPRPGRSLTRSESKGSTTALPTSRSLSFNSRPPVPSSGSNLSMSASNVSEKSNTNEESEETTSSATSKTHSISSRARFRNRSLSKSRLRSHSQDSTNSKEKTEDSSANGGSPARAGTGRSPFSRIMAEKSSTPTRRTAKGKSKYEMVATARTRIAKTRPSSPSSTDSPPAQDAEIAAKEEETKVPSSSPDDSEPKEKIDTSTVETESGPDTKPQDEPAAEDHVTSSSPVDKSADKSVMFDEYVDPSPETLNTSVLSQENVAKHTSVGNNDAADEFGDPPLQELESEVSAETEQSLMTKYALTASILGSLATSPVREVVSPVHDTEEEKDNTDKNADDKEDSHERVRTNPGNNIAEEKKEADEEDQSEKNAHAWDLSNAKFHHFASSQDDDFHPTFSEDVWEPEIDTQFSGSAFSNTQNENGDGEENKEQTGTPSSEDKKTESLDHDLKSPTAPASSANNNGDAYDAFDTSSWAAGSVTGFSNASFSKVDVDINGEKNFVNMMKEEMKFRTLSEEERKMMFEANEKIMQAEENAEKELNKVQKDDEPLIVQHIDSNSVEGSEANTGVSLEDRLKIYAKVEADEDSEDSSDKNGESDDHQSSDEEAEMAVEYVGQNNEDDDEIDINGTETPSSSPVDGSLVASNDVPTLEVAASAASATMVNQPNAEASSAGVPIPKTLEELKLAGAPPPPPPPGGPKKKKKKKKSKSKKSSDKEKVIPLIAPPSEEKMKKWKNEQQKAQNYVAAMAERLASTATKALAEASSEYFHFKPVDEHKDDEPEEENDIEEETMDEKELHVPVDGEAAGEEPKATPTIDSTDAVTDEVPPSQCEQDEEKETIKSQDEDSVSDFAKKVQLENEQTVALHTAPKNNLWRKEVADAIGLVERLEEEYDQDAFPKIASFPTPLSELAVTQSATLSVGNTTKASQHSREVAREVIESKVSEEKEPVSGDRQTEVSEEKEPISDDCPTEVLEEKEPVSDDRPTEVSEEKKPVSDDRPTEEIKQSITTDTDCSDCELLVKDRLLTVEVHESTPKSPKQSMFSSPKSTARSTKGSMFSEKTKISSDARSILSDSKMADKVAMASSAAASTFEERFTPRNEVGQSSKVSIPKGFETLYWFSKEVVKKEFATDMIALGVSKASQSYLENNENFNLMCRFVADKVNEVSIEIKPSLQTTDSDGDHQLMSRTESADPSMANSMSTTTSGDSDDSQHSRILLKPVVLSDASIKLSSKYLAANFVSFLYMASKLTKVPSPFGDNNPFLAMIVASSLETIDVQEPKTVQELIFGHLDGKAEQVIDFVHAVNASCDSEMEKLSTSEEGPTVEVDVTIQSNQHQEAGSSANEVESTKRLIVPDAYPSPFESSVMEVPRIVAAALSFLGDPIAVCRMKEVNKYCRRIVTENEHTLMQDAVRTGGIDAKIRPAFWIYVALEKSDASNRENKFNGSKELSELELGAEEGKWHHVIQRDVERSFGNMPPHKTGATFQSDSIVPALVTWGQNRLMKRGVKGGGEPVPTPDIGETKQDVKRKCTNISSPPWKCDESAENESAGGSPVNTVSDWGAATTEGSPNDSEEQTSTLVDMSTEEIALCGNSLSADAKADLQKKLSFVLHTLAATYEDIGYCQGMDYVVAHLLRNLQDTIRLKAANKRLPPIISTSSELQITDDVEAMNKDIDANHVIEETIIRIMDTFFVNYNLKHMYWPELRCLKTCCRVFERLIQIKLPVLADHFEHHDLNVGLFALGWFQTLFLYLPSMPSATVCHMWDIWLVERSFKIFFRVGAAILFLSQPTLLNQELEGMMTYLNTIPDATMLRPDILIPCALNIKVTNRLLQELEDEVMKSPN